MRKLLTAACKIIILIMPPVSYASILQDVNSFHCILNFTSVCVGLHIKINSVMFHGKHLAVSYV